MVVAVDGVDILAICIQDFQARLLGRVADPAHSTLRVGQVEKGLALFHGNSVLQRDVR